MNKKQQYATLFLCAILVASLLMAPINAARIRPAHLLEGLFPDKALPSVEDESISSDPADGMPEDERQGERFGGKSGVKERAASGEDSQAVDENSREGGISVWMAVLVVCLAATAVVVAVIYLVPRKNRDSCDR